MFFFFLIVVLVLLLLVAMLVLLERNILGVDQLRKGPNITGWYGILQTVSDGIKLILKVFLFTPGMRFFFFFLSPLIGLFLSLFNWFFVSVSFVISSMEMTVVLTLFVGSMMVYTVVWAGWGSNSAYSVIGSIRAVAQMISYEVVLGLFVFFFIYNFSSYSWESFFFSNYMGGFFFFFLLFFMWVVVMMAELNRTPFDLVEGESELVGGFNVEYSGSGFTLLFLSEYVNIWFMCAISVIIFFGFFFGFFFSFFMVFFLGIFVVHIRGLLPRYKFFDLIVLTWKVFLPLILFFLVFSFCF
uniref:NADH-ubiquinone oxidoreductase chain 1 n=1 Tax=Rhopalaea idoneta TaxID=1712670 RepID=A0A173QSX8_9ASCI|nr:NADH dehydrogenase subunit 1 [Rhopalaea idoneta]